MRWASTLSDQIDTRAAIAEASTMCRRQLGADADLVFVFASAHHAEHYKQIPTEVAAALGVPALIGCSAGGVIGAGREIEGEPALSLTAAVLPQVDLVTFHLEGRPPPPDDIAAWEKWVGVPVREQPSFVIFPDPFSCDVEALLRGLDQVYPGSVVVGGLASGAREAGDNGLFCGRALHSAGAVGLALCGNIKIDTVVAQGCRPIGQPMFVTQSRENVIWELDSRPALDVLKDLYQSLPRADQDLARHSLFLGVVMNEDQSEYRQGDFLIRNLLGMDPERGVIVVGAALADNAVVQFHLRDANTSKHDLKQMLEHYDPTTPPHAALLFSCLGRGAGLYGEPDHDSTAFRRNIGPLPLGGFFCNGEIGPVHGTTFLHGYTSVFGVFRPRYLSQ